VGGSSSDITGTYTITQADIDAGSVTNSALAIAKAPNNNDVTDTSGTANDNDLSTVTTLTQTPAVALVKTASLGGTGTLGDVITYTFTVTNTGNTTLTNVVVTDPMVGLTLTGSPIASLGVGASSSVITGTYTITQANINAGSVTNLATATSDEGASDISGTTNTNNTATVTTLSQTPAVANEIIANDDDFGTYFIGYSGRIGNILENDRLNGLRPNDVDVDFEFTDLDGVIGLLIDENGELSLIPGVNEAREYNLKYTLREVVNPSNSDDAFLVFRLLNDQVDLGVTKTSFDAEIFEGDEFEYQITLTNIGEIPATNVILADDLPNAITYISSRVESVSGSQIEVGTPAITGSRVTWAIPFLPAGGRVGIRVRVKAGAAGSITNVAKISASEDDTNEVNNQGSDVNQILPFHIPNVITPNNDGDNDVFEIPGLDKFVSNEITIFNRYGDHVLEQKSYKNDWNAPGQVAGTYFYILTTVDSSGKAHTFRGWIQVIRGYTFESWIQVIKD
jgi:gliding motility-associated-like protein/uncharacterized repeat protein (TIGR01451 family)